MRAYLGIRSAPHYRADAFATGLKAAGHEVRHGPPQQFDSQTLLLIWNRYSEWDSFGTQVERAGGKVLVAENGYIGHDGVSPHSMENRDVYALARGGHNGSGWTPEGSAERWEALRVDLQPWRTDGAHIVVAPNRSFGRPGYIMPLDWAAQTAKRLRELTKREVRIRPHPGNAAAKKPLAEDLRDAWATIIWASSAGVHSLLAGVPVIAQAPAWIAMGAAGTDLAQIESPPMPDRLPAMHKLASAQWTLDEIASGLPFARLLA